MACKLTVTMAVAPITNQIEPITKAAFNSVVTLLLLTLSRGSASKAYFDYFYSSKGTPMTCYEFITNITFHF